jgi:hypothetical protein
MGNARWSDTDWQAHAKATSSKTQSQIFTSSGMSPDLDPKTIKFRESRDSSANPNSTPIILAVDETGSMGVLAEKIIKSGLGTIMKAIYDRKPVSDPHIMCMAIGDAYCDSAPLQVTQFEASVGPMTTQVEKMYLEGNGGGNDGESYALAWLFTAAKTKCDAIKRGRKGFLFTIGDEACHRVITSDQSVKFAGIPAESDIDAKVLHDYLAKDWNIFHLIVETGATQQQNAVSRWRELLGERAIVIKDIDSLAEGIVSVIQVVSGSNPVDVANSWDAPTAVVVRSITNQMAIAS